uniref:NB-ARC domain-containing protein n=1 Tax=Fagus sylvatica TaxID=28930 RepID=A0A2N9F8W9_FAGSY
MADAIVYDLLKQLASITTQQAKEEIKLIVGVDEEVQELKHKLRIIQVMLDNEEERQVEAASWNTARIKLTIEKEEDINAAPAVKKKGSQEERKPRVISLVGMGGLGKTTLAQLAYNDPEVKAHFEQRMWVCVSDPFDQCRVAKAICQELCPNGPYNNITELETLLCTIRGMIMGQEVPLVLDDVWTEDSKKWEPFKLVFENGAQDSRILVTTRKLGVAKMMASAPINLEVLSEEDCWLIFSKIAFSNEDQRKDLEDLGRQLAIKCKGLPLAVKTLGSLMHNKTSREQWKNILDSSLWELEDVERGVFAPLFLSYYDLPSPMKRCFSYCATFPKDYNFNKYELVLLWMAQGYIDSKENMETKAEEYFEVLAMRSFFQDFEKDEYDGRIDEIFPSPICYNGGDVILPKGIGKLTSLKTLRDFYICGKDEREECKVGELKNLDELRVLRINGLRNVVDVSEAENAQLKKKKYLRHLILRFGKSFNDERDGRVMKNLLYKLIVVGNWVCVYCGQLFNLIRREANPIAVKVFDKIPETN